jgi:hypothetical protein
LPLANLIREDIVETTNRLDLHATYLSPSPFVLSPRGEERRFGCNLSYRVSKVKNEMWLIREEIWYNLKTIG